MRYLKTILVGVSFLISSTSVQAKEAVQIIHLEGVVSYGGKKVKKGQWLSRGKILRAEGEESLVDLRFSEGSQFRLKNGSLTLSRLEKKNTEFRLNAGTSFISVKKKQRKFRLKTHTATMGIRGTKFFVQEFPKEKKSYLCVCTGEVTMKKGTSIVSVRAGQDLWSEGEKPLGSPHAATKNMWKMAVAGFQKMGIPVTEIR